MQMRLGQSLSCWVLKNRKDLVAHLCSVQAFEPSYTFLWVGRVLPEAKFENRWTLFFELFDLIDRYWPEIGNPKVWRTNELTNGLTWVGARDTCVSKNQTKLRQSFDNSKMSMTQLMWPWHARWSSRPIVSELTTLVNVCIRAKREFWNPVAKFDINPQEILIHDVWGAGGGD